MVHHYTSHGRVNGSISTHALIATFNVSTHGGQGSLRVFQILGIDGSRTEWRVTFCCRHSMETVALSDIPHQITPVIPRDASRGSDFGATHQVHAPALFHFYLGLLAVCTERKNWSWFWIMKNAIHNALLWEKYQYFPNKAVEWNIFWNMATLDMAGVRRTLWTWALFCRRILVELPGESFRKITSRIWINGRKQRTVLKELEEFISAELVTKRFKVLFPRLVNQSSCREFITDEERLVKGRTIVPVREWRQQRQT